MASFESNFKALKDQVLVLTGGANGIGRATVKLLHSHGANVIFGDISAKAGESLCVELNSSTTTPSVHFLPTDVASYAANLALFKLALSKYNHIEHAFSTAGIVEKGSVFSPSLDLDSVSEPPNVINIDVNLTAVLYFTRISSVYLRQGNTSKADKSIVLLSSIAGFLESPSLFVYQPAKHGVMGILRSTRKHFLRNHSIRVNAVCPWYVATGMVVGIEEGWNKEKLPVNQPEDVAKIIVGLAEEKRSTGSLFGCVGGKGLILRRALIGCSRSSWERRIVGRLLEDKSSLGWEMIGLVSRTDPSNSSQLDIFIRLTVKDIMSDSIYSALFQPLRSLKHSRTRF